MTEQEMEKQLDELKKNYEKAASEVAKKEIKAQMDELEKKFTSQIPDTKKLETSIEDVKKSATDIKVTLDELDKTVKANQPALDNLIAASKKGENNPAKKKSFVENFAEAVEANWSDITKVSKGKKFSMEMKAAGNMTVSANLTGDGTLAYGGQVILPSQAINARDIVPTTPSPNRTFVRHREKTTGEGVVAQQTEGSSKNQIDIDFEEVKTVTDYVSGFTRFSKQMTKELSFFQSTLPRILLRKFYEAENSQFWTDVTGTSGISTYVGAETDDVLTLIDAIGWQLADNYVPSYIIVNPHQLAKINKLLYGNGWNMPGGGVVSERNGQVFIYNVPIVQASWAVSDKGLLIDSSYIERVEAEGLTIEFFEQDGDNVTKNLITARIECLEEFNLMLPASARYWDFGNSA